MAERRAEAREAAGTGGVWVVLLLALTAAAIWFLAGTRVVEGAVGERPGQIRVDSVRFEHPAIPIQAPPPLRMA